MKPNVGGPPATPLAMRVCELLDDGEWKPFEAIAREAGKLVPPGQAMRRAEVRRKGQRHGAPAQRSRPISEERAIASGRRSFVRDTINATRQCFEFKQDDDDVEYVRMTSLPPRVRRDRARQRAHHHFVPGDLADEIRDGAHAAALIKELSLPQLQELAMELAKREQARAGA